MGLGDLYVGATPGDPVRARANAARISAVADRTAALVSAATTKLALLPQDDPSRPQGIRLASELHANLEALIVERGRVLAYADWLEAAQQGRDGLNDFPVSLLPGVLPAESSRPWWHWTRLSVILAAASGAPDAITDPLGADPLAFQDAAVLAVTAWRRSNGMPGWSPDAPASSTATAGEPHGMVTVVATESDGIQELQMWLLADRCVLRADGDSDAMPSVRAAELLADRLDVKTAADVPSGQPVPVSRDVLENLLAADVAVRTQAAGQLAGEMADNDLRAAFASGQWRAWAACVVRPVGGVVDGSGILVVATPDAAWLAQPGPDIAMLRPASSDDLSHALAVLAAGGRPDVAPPSADQ